MSGANSGCQLSQYPEQYLFGLLGCVVVFAAEKMAGSVKRDGWLAAKP
jgi:hypothetical protein